MQSLRLSYTQDGACFNEKIDIDLSIMRGNNDEIVLIIPGVDGSLDGYLNKYRTIAEQLNSKYDAIVIRMSNPHNPMHEYNRNIFEVLKYIEEQFDMKNMKLRIVGHSLGAYMAGSVAYMFDYIDKVLMINPVTRIDWDDMRSLIERPKSSNIFLIGDKDASYDLLKNYKQLGTVHVVRGADHHFSDKSLDSFIDAPARYLFES